MLVAAPLATATLALAALWAAGVLWPLLVRARLGAYAAAAGWAWLRLPAWTGWAFGQVITRFATFGHLIHTRTLAATPWLQRWPWRLHLRVHAEDFGFGNPPGFPHTFFVEARTVDVRVSCGLPDLWRWLFGIRVALPLAADPEYRGYGVFRVDVLECNGVTINFEMFRGEFNINGFERLLAQGAVRRKLRRGAPMPNMLRVGVGSAVGLNGGSLNLLTGERAIRPRVVLHVREHRLSTGTAARDTTPGAAPNAYSWGEELALPIDDPSAVLHVCVYDDTPGGESLLGQWVMTLKWLVIEPSWCEHSSLHVAADGAVRGWFVLSDGASASASASATPLLDTPRRLGVGETRRARAHAAVVARARRRRAAAAAHRARAAHPQLCGVVAPPRQPARRSAVPREAAVSARRAARHRAPDVVLREGPLHGAQRPGGGGGGRSGGGQRRRRGADARIGPDRSARL